MELVKSLGRGGSKLPLGSRLLIATAKEAKGCFILRALDLTCFSPKIFSVPWSEPCAGTGGLPSRALVRCFIYKGDGILGPS